MALMMEQLMEDPTKIPKPSRDDMMRMAEESVRGANFNAKQALKENYILNALDGSEAHLVRDEITDMIGEEVEAFRREWMEKPLHELPQTLNALLSEITPPEGVKVPAPRDEPPVDEGEEMMHDGEFEVCIFVVILNLF